MMAGGMAVFGENAWGVRFGGAVATALTAAMLYLIAIHIHDRRTALWAAIIWATGLLPAAAAHVASTDIYLAAAETVAVGAFIIGWQRARRSWFVLMWTAFGVAFLTKGPPGLLPLMPIAIFAWRLRMLRPVFNVAGILLFLGIGLSWYLIVITRYPGLLEYFIGTEVVARVSSDNVHNPEWYRAIEIYAPMMILGLGAWGVLALFHALRRKPVARALSAWKQCTPEAFLLLWIVLPLAVFCIVTSKLPLYVLPLAAPVTLLTARELTRRHRDRILAWIACASAILIVSLKFGSAHIEHKNNMLQLAAAVEPVLQEVDPDSQLLVFRQTQMFGLQFYLRRPLTRVSDIGQQSDYPVEVYPLHDYLAKRQHSLVLVTRKSNLDSLRAAAALDRWSYVEKRTTRDWSIGLLIPITSPESD